MLGHLLSSYRIGYCLTQHDGEKVKKGFVCMGVNVDHNRNSVSHRAYSRKKRKQEEESLYVSRETTQYTHKTAMKIKAGVS